MTDQQRAAMQAALDALELIRDADTAGSTPKTVVAARATYEPTIDMLRAALAQPETPDGQKVDAEVWAEVWRLRAAVQGPDGFDTWQAAATAERIRRVKAERELRELKAAQPEQKAEPALYWPTQMPDEVAKWITENPPKITAGPPTLTLDQAQKIARDCIGLNLGDKLPDSLLRLTTYYCCEKAVGTGSTVCSDCSQHPYPKENPL